MTTYTAYQNSIRGKDIQTLTFEDIKLVEGEVRNANSQAGFALARIRSQVLDNPNATILDIAIAQRELVSVSRSHSAVLQSGFAIQRKFNPALFFEWGPNETEEDLDALERVQDIQSATKYGLTLKSQINSAISELRRRLKALKEGKTIKEEKDEQAVAEKQDDTGTDEEAVGTSEGGSVKQAIDSNDEKAKVTAKETVSEDGNVSTGGSNANSVGLIGPPTTQEGIEQLLFTDGTGPGTFAEDTQVGDDSITRDGITYPNAFFEDIVTKPNPLLQFAHYTYRIGLYLQTPQQYTKMILTGDKDVSALPKILESGGTGAQAPSRDVIFPDLYIDDLELESLMMGNTGGAHNAVAINFNIIEPMGFRFLDQLRQLCSNNGMYGFSRQHYLMVISFTGYDEDGAELTPDNIESMTKYIPFTFTKITTTVRTGATQYACEAVPPAYAIGQSIKRSKIRFNVELAGRTLNDIFNAEGGDPRTDATAPRESIPVGGGDYTEYARRNAAAIQATKTSGGVPPLSTQGVIEALNKEQIELVKKGTQSVADKFKVTFMNNIGNEKVVKNEALQRGKSNVPMNSETTQAKEATQNTGMDITIEKFSSVAGMSVHQFIDTMLRASSYVTKQQNFTFDEKTMKLVPNPKSQDSFLQWYNIATVATPIAWDEKRNTYAYNIEFIVSPKKINDVYSSYFDQAKFRGTHKKYSYWFTGENTEVIDFEQELNASFYVAMDNKVDNTLTDRPTTPNNEKDNSYEADDGTGKYGDPANRAANIIYSPVDFARSIMTIFGDPDYIQQNEVFFRSGETFDAFLPDGSVNTESNEVLYEIFFRTMNDYNDDTGQAVLQTPELTANGLIYRLIRATSRFSKGQMTQELEGLIREFDDKKGDEQRERVAAPVRGDRRQPSTRLTSSYTQNSTDITDRRYGSSPGDTNKRNRVTVMGDGSSNYNTSSMGTNNNNKISGIGTDDDPRLSVTSNYNQQNADRSSYGPVNNRVNRKEDTKIIKRKSIRDTIFPEGGGA